MLGNDWDKVHAWLDGLAWTTFPSMEHRKERHHKEGVEEVRRMWGDEAAKAAELHILSDIAVWGWKEVPTEERIRAFFATQLEVIHHPDGKTEIQRPK